MIDQEIVKRFIGGDKAALEEVYRRLFSKAVRLADSYLHDTTIAQDLTHETFISVWQHRGSLDADICLDGYIIKSLRNRCLNYLRDSIIHQKAAQNIQRTMLDISYLEFRGRNNVMDKVEAKDLFEALTKALSNLPSKSREVFVLNRARGLSYEEIALIQGVSVKNIEYRMMSVLRYLRKHLKDYL